LLGLLEGRISGAPVGRLGGEVRISAAPPSWNTPGSGQQTLWIPTLEAAAEQQQQQKNPTSPTKITSQLGPVWMITESQNVWGWKGPLWVI